MGRWKTVFTTRNAFTGGIVATTKRLMGIAFYSTDGNLNASASVALDNRRAHRTLHWNSLYSWQLECPQLELLHHSGMKESSNDIKRKVGIRRYHSD